MAGNKQNIFLRIVATFRQMTWKEHVLYWILPWSFIWALALGYFAAPRWLQEIIAPATNRELGLHETIEHSIILVIVVMALLTVFKARGALLKLIFFICFLGSLFMFLEEIDYGKHYVDFFRGISYSENPVNFNFHNQKKQTINTMMKVCYLLIAVFFVILPQVKREKLPGWLQQLTPSTKLFFTVLVLPLVGRFPLALNKLNFKPNNSLFDNLSEFEELGVYYIFLLYFIEMYRKQGEEVTAVKVFSAGSSSAKN
jgi:glucan phosphoethanolaminetransferase (alkaline phosphatase superfamily)